MGPTSGPSLCGNEGCCEPPVWGEQQPVPMTTAAASVNVRLALDIADAERQLHRANNAAGVARKVVEEADRVMATAHLALVEDLGEYWRQPPIFPTPRTSAEQRAVAYTDAVLQLQEATERWVDAVAVQRSCWTELQRLHELLTPGFDRRNATQAGYSRQAVG